MDAILSAGQILTDDEILRELSKVARANVDLKGSDKLKGLELLAKHRGLIKERVETTDLTDSASTEAALLLHITMAAKDEGISELLAAQQLHARMVRTKHPTLSDPASWPERDSHGNPLRALLIPVPVTVEPDEVGGEM